MIQKGPTVIFSFSCKARNVFISSRSREMTSWPQKLLTDSGSSGWLNNVQVTGAASVRLASWLALHHPPSRQTGIVARPGHVRLFAVICQIGELICSAAGFVSLFVFFIYLNKPSECARQRFVCHDFDCKLFLVFGCQILFAQSSNMSKNYHK